MADSPTCYQEVAYCAREVDRQDGTPLEVLGMYRAWLHGKMVIRAHKHLERPEVFEADLQLLAAFIKNVSFTSYRTVPVVFKNYLHVNAKPQEVPRLMKDLVQQQATMRPEDFVREFLVIHPFADGNGRVASIVWNILHMNETPKDLPDFGWWER